MKRVKHLGVIALAVAVGCGVIGFIILKRQPKRVAGVASLTPPVATEPAQAPVPPAVEETSSPTPGPGPTPEPPPPPKAVKSAPKNPPMRTPSNQGGGQADPPPLDPLAREALSFVGMDSDATAYWVGAINDPILPAEERKNLIEDLNEDGLPDPKYPTIEDLPLIMSRIRLIEQLVPDAMDQNNFDAFAEAYKDLLNLAALARGGGEPVR